MISFNKNLLILLVLAFCYANLFAQKNDKKALELKNYFWKESGNDFKVTEVPQKWKEKQAVIIARSFEKFYKKRRIGGLEYFDYEHYRIKIQSKKALEDYAEFSFPESTTFVGYGIKFYVGYKIIKPDGKEIEVSLDDAVVAEMKVNRYELNMKKLAIPNLEIGDIVDFYIAEEQHIPPVDNYYSFDPSIYVLVAAYPIMKQKITFDVERKCYLNAKSLNGAPEFVKQKKDDNDVYVLEDEDRENYEDSKWMYPYRQLPTVKFKAVFAKGAITYSPLFIGKQGVLKDEVTEKEVVNFVNAYLNDYTASGVYLHKQLKKSLKGRIDKAKMAEEIFYLMRNHFMVRHIESYIQADKSQHPEYSNYKMLSALSYTYDRFDIDHKILVGVPRSISTIQDIILENEIIIAIKVLDEFVTGNLDNYTPFGEYPYSLEGTEVYEFKDKSLVKVANFPVSNAEDNNITKELNFTIKDLENDESTIEIKNIISGHQKEDFHFQLLDFYDYKDEEAEEYNMEEYSNSAKKNAHKKYLLKKETFINEVQEKKLDYLKALTELNYDLEIKEVKDLVINEHGRHHSKPNFEFDFKADFEGLIKKAGNNYLVSVGKLIEGQVNLEKDELERDSDIYMPYPRSFNHNIVFNIPDGYTVEGIENLNVDVTTDYGGFVSTAEINNDGQLVFKSHKYYSTNFVPVDGWDAMKTFLKAAEDFNEKSVLLKAVE